MWCDTDVQYIMRHVYDRQSINNNLLNVFKTYTVLYNETNSSMYNV